MHDIVRISDSERQLKTIEGFLESHKIAYDSFYSADDVRRPASNRDALSELEVRTRLS